jgi:hypothetical protein
MTSLVGSGEADGDGGRVNADSPVLMKSTYRSSYASLGALPAGSYAARQFEMRVPVAETGDILLRCPRTRV